MSESPVAQLSREAVAQRLAACQVAPGCAERAGRAGERMRITYLRVAMTRLLARTLLVGVAVVLPVRHAGRMSEWIRREGATIG